jgi:TRAP transporter TAXI family solute receptor
MMKDHRLDAVAAAAQVPASQIVEAAVMTPMKNLIIDPDILQVAAKQLGGQIETISKDSYSFQNNDIKTVTTNTIIVTSADQPDNLIYTITKAMFENQDYMQSVHAILKRFTPKYGAALGDLPLHPGAKQYFKEIGIVFE